MNLRTLITHANVRSDEGTHPMSESIRLQNSLRLSSSGTMLRWILRTVARAIPIELVGYDLPGITHPSKRQSKRRSARMWGDRAPAISGYQIVSAVNRTVESNTSGSVVDSSIQEIQQTFALQTTQLIGILSKIRMGDFTITASGMCSAISTTVRVQPKLASALRITERKRLGIHPRTLMEGRDLMKHRSE